MGILESLTKGQFPITAVSAPAKLDQLPKRMPGGATGSPGILETGTEFFITNESSLPEIFVASTSMRRMNARYRYICADRDV